MNNVIPLGVRYKRRRGPKLDESNPQNQRVLNRRIKELERAVAKLEAEVFFYMSLDTKGQPRIVTIGTIAELVTARTGFDLSELRCPRRQQDLCNARHLFMYLAKKHTRLSLPVIAKFLCKDHTSILHGVRRIEERMKTEEHLKHLVDELSRELRKIAEA